MTNMPIELQRTLMQLEDIQAYVESLDAEDHAMRSMHSSIRSLRALVKYNGGDPKYDSVKQYFKERGNESSI